jgi:hypothetical protein
MAEHPAATPATAAAHVVPAPEEIAAAAVPAERAAPGVVLLVMAVVAFGMAEVVFVVALMHGMEEIVESHGGSLYRQSVSTIYRKNV